MNKWPLCGLTSTSSGSPPPRGRVSNSPSLTVGLAGSTQKILYWSSSEMNSLPEVESKAKPVGSSVKFRRLNDSMRVPSSCCAHRFVLRKNGFSSTSEFADEEPLQFRHIGYPGGIRAAERRHVGARHNLGGGWRDVAAGRYVADD